MVIQYSLSARSPSYFVSQVTGEKSVAGDYVLVPFVDSMNHVTTAKTELSFSPVSGDLRVSVNRCVHPEDELCVCVS